MTCLEGCVCLLYIRRCLRARDMFQRGRRRPHGQVASVRGGRRSRSLEKITSCWTSRGRWPNADSCCTPCTGESPHTPVSHRTHRSVTAHTGQSPHTPVSHRTHQSVTAHTTSLTHRSVTAHTGQSPHTQLVSHTGQSPHTPVSHRTHQSVTAHTGQSPHTPISHRTHN